MITIVMLHISMSNLKGESASTINFFNHSFNTRLFFFLSGMVVALGGADFSNLKNAWNFGIKKAKSLLLPFMVWSVFIMPYIYDLVIFVCYTDAVLMHKDYVFSTIGFCSK